MIQTLFLVATCLIVSLVAWQTTRSKPYWVWDWFALLVQVVLFGITACLPATHSTWPMGWVIYAGFLWLLHAWSTETRVKREIGRARRNRLLQQEEQKCRGGLHS